VVGVAEAVWARQSVWSQAANRLKVGIGRARTAGLGLTIAAAVLATLATQVASLSSAVGKALSLAAAVAVGLAPVARSRLAPASVAGWTRARSVSEALKSELYTYVAGTGPYRAADRDQQLDTRTQQVLTDAVDLLRHTAGLRPAERPLPAVRDVDSYLTARLEPQLRWYTDRAAELETKLTRVRYALLALSVLGVVLAAVAATLEVTAAAAWLTVLTTVSAAVTAYAAGSRYEYQLVEYLRTASQLDRLRVGWVAVKRDRAADDGFVADCEQVVSVQNEAWMAKWTGDDDAATGPGVT
jgi:hypothetical protein